MGDLKRKIDIEEQLAGETVDKPKSSCSILAIVIFLSVILLIFAGALTYIKFKNYKLIVPRGDSSTLDLRSKIEKQIDDQSADQTITITINESDINSAFSSYPSFPLKNPAVKISKSDMTVFGKYGFIKIDVLVVPKVANGKIDYEITEIKAAGVAAPKKISDSVSSEIRSFMLSTMPTTTKRVYIDKVELQPGIIQATGHKK